MFEKVVVANRGAVAGRVLRALNGLGVKSVAVYSDADADAPWLDMAVEPFRLGAGPARASYLYNYAFIQVIAQTGADGPHHGYGLLVVNNQYAAHVKNSGADFCGPSPSSNNVMGDRN